MHAAVPYSEQITEVVKDLAASGASSDSPLLAGRGEIKKTCYVAITADRGLCGGYNAGVQRSTEGEVKADVLAGRDYVDHPGRPQGRGLLPVPRLPPRPGRSPASPTSRPTTTPRRSASTSSSCTPRGEVDSVELVYTRFISAGSQEVVLRPLVPLHGETIAGGDGQAAAPTAPRAPAATTSSSPTRRRSSTRSFPRYVEARIYAALLNAAASEHAFRQRAMKAATDNAEELIKSLSRIMNRARQDSITTEIMEIVSGAEALDSDSTALPYIELGDLYASATPGA